MKRLQKGVMVSVTTHTDVPEAGRVLELILSHM